MERISVSVAFGLGAFRTTRLRLAAGAPRGTDGIEFLQSAFKLQVFHLKPCIVHRWFKRLIPILFHFDNVQRWHLSSKQQPTRRSMKKSGRHQFIEDKTKEKISEKDFLNESAAKPLKRAARIQSYAYDEGQGKMTFVVQKAHLHPILKHLRSKNLNAWSCFSNVVMGEIIVEATPEASEEALSDFQGYGIAA